MISDIFKIPIWHTNLSQNLNLIDIEKCCLNIEKHLDKIVVTNLGGYQSNPLVFENYPELFDLYKTIIHQAKTFCNEINIKEIEKISSLWVNINEYGHYNREHHHANNILSGVFYAHSKRNIKAGSITFKHPAADLMTFNWSGIQKDFVSENSSKWQFPCVPGHLIIFPSWLIHSVEPNLAKDYKRISISFNLNY
jgi:uncharacterized protein (TIGR02466 family)